MVIFNKSAEIALKSTQLNYILTSPDHVKKGEKLPLIVFLHGAGERGNDINQVNIYCVPKLFTKNPQHKGLRVYTLSPQCPVDTTWIDYKKEIEK